MPGPFLSQKTHPRFSRSKESSRSVLFLVASKLRRSFQSTLRKLESTAFLA